MTQNTTQAIILAAGSSSRFHPYNQTHKSALTLMGKPIMYWTLDSISRTTINNILVVINPRDETMKNLLQHYPHKDSLTIKTVYQQQAKGQADAIIQCLPHLSDNFLVVDCSQVNAASHIKHILSKQSPIVLAAKPTNHPEKYGVLFTENEKVTAIKEKPQEKINNPMRQFGYWLLTKDFVNNMAQKSNQEYLLEESLNTYAQNHSEEDAITTYTYTGETPTLKYAWDVLKLKNFIFKSMQANNMLQISKKAKISKTAHIKGPAFIDDNALIGDYAIVEGPVYIGKKAVVGRYSVVRKKTVLEDGAEAQSYCDIKDSIIMKNAHIHSGFIGDSIIGQNCRIGAGFVTANRRLDRGNIHAYVKEKKVNTRTSYLGAIIGHRSKLGIKCSTSPNVILSNDSIIKPNTHVKKNV